MAWFGVKFASKLTNFGFSFPKMVNFNVLKHFFLIDLNKFDFHRSEALKVLIWNNVHNIPMDESVSHHIGIHWGRLAVTAQLL